MNFWVQFQLLLAGRTTFRQNLYSLPSRYIRYFRANKCLIFVMVLISDDFLVTKMLKKKIRFDSCRIKLSRFSHQMSF